MKVGAYKIDCVSDGAFFVDGSVFFGQTPHTDWTKEFPPDGNNRIMLPLRCFLLRGHNRCILVDTGFGQKTLPKDLNKIYGRHMDENLLSNLQTLGVGPGDVTDVINTHLHVSHCGWNTAITERDGANPVFSRARYWIQKQEWEKALKPHALAARHYDKRNFLALEKKADLRLIKGDTEIAPGVRVEVVAGHSGADQIVIVDSSDATIVFTGDFIPTLFHLDPAILEGKDLFPIVAHDRKLKFLEIAAAQKWMIAPPHDPACVIAKIMRGKDGYTARCIEKRLVDPWK